MVEIPFKIMHLVKELTPRKAKPHSLDLWRFIKPAPSPSLSQIPVPLRYGGGCLAGWGVGVTSPTPNVHARAQAQLGTQRVLG